MSMATGTGRGSSGDSGKAERLSRFALVTHFLMYIEIQYSLITTAYCACVDVYIRNTQSSLRTNTKARWSHFQKCSEPRYEAYDTSGGDCWGCGRGGIRKGSGTAARALSIGRLGRASTGSSGRLPVGGGSA